MKLSKNQLRLMRAVDAGKVRHAHPFVWVVTSDLLDVRGYERMLQALANRTLIKVDAGSSEHYRPVRLTIAGEKALNAAVVAIVGGSK